MKLGAVLVALAMFVASEGASSQTGSQPGLIIATDRKTELPDSLFPSADVSAKSQEKQPTFLPIGDDPENRLVMPFMNHWALDQKRFWAAPFHVNREDARYLVPFAAFTGALIAGDSWISRQVPASQIERSKSMSNYTTYSLIGAAGASYFWGHFKHNDRLGETGFLAGDAALNSTAVAYLFKTATQRPRPSEGNGSGTFFRRGASFPSEHSAIAWSVAGVVAHEYPGTWTKIAAYGLASTVTLARVTGKQHFPSDVVVGSALGWNFARQIYRAHHDPELGGAGWSTFAEDSDNGESDKGEKLRNPANMGSPYLPLDSWAYPAMERLVALGYIQSADLGMRPWTRMECARLLEEEAGERIPEDGGEARKIYDSLAEEFSEESARLGGGANWGIGVDSVYTRLTGISGKPIDGFDFGQTIVNDYGRPYSEGFSNVTGFTSHGVAGPFSFYVKGEYQHAPWVPPLSVGARNAIEAIDFVPAAPPGTATAPVNRADLLEGYVGLQLENWQITFGRQALWWGADAGGPMLFSSNAAPILMLQINRVKPLRLPSFLGLLGEARFDYILGRLTGQHWVFKSGDGFTGSWAQPLRDQPFLVGQKVTFKPTPDLEWSISMTGTIGGPGVPFTTHQLLAAMFSTSTGAPGTPADPANRRGGFDLVYRIPKLRDWLTWYVDAFTDDEVNPWLDWDKAAFTSGIYVSHVPGIPKLDLRVEGTTTDLPWGPGTVHQPGFFYFNYRFRSGYANDGNLIGNWIGREGQGAEAWTTYWFSPKNNLQFHFRHQKVSRQFIPNGGTLTDFGVRGEYWIRPRLGLSGWVQDERWLFPVIQPNVSRNITAAAEVIVRPRKLFGHSRSN